MKSITFFIIFQIFFVFVYCKYSEIDYYAKLIRNEEERSKTFTLPTDAKKAKPYNKIYIEYGTFDHIVVGAGSAGAIVASRLSEDNLRHVLLLEAGGEQTNITDIPAMARTMLNLEYNWNYLTIPQTSSCLGMNERRCAFPRGKMISGSSGINGLIYTRGSKIDFDIWCNQGNPGWCYKDVLPFFKKSENSKINGDPGYHGVGGYLNVEYTKPRNKYHYAFIEANKQLNRSYVDYNGRRQEGFGFTQYNSKNGRRASTGRMFLQPALNRKNLNVLTHSHVARILINSKTKRAFGVLFAKDNKYYVARSRKDIILSAGTIGSPQLLMLSGVGQRSHLEKLKIGVISDLSVGKNFQDHVGINVLHFITNISEGINYQLEDNIKDYFNGIGPFTDAYDAKAITFARTRLTNTDDFSDVELLQVQSATTFPLHRAIYNFNAETFKHGWTNFNFNNSFTVVLLLMHPLSRGYIKLKSADPFDYPIINSQFLSDPNLKDLETMVEGVQLVLKLLETNAFQKLSARLHRVHLPACKDFDYLSRDYWICHIRYFSTPYAHPVGTCKMGPNPLQGAVVDHKLKVYGIKNLRVADASIMPNIPGGHTNAPAMMIGEKASHMILHE